MFDVLCIIWGGQLIFAFLTVTTYKEKDSLLYQNLIEEEETPESWAEKNIKLIDMIKSHEFLYLYLIFMCFVFYGHYILNVFKIYGFETIHDDHLLTFVGSFGALFNGVCRIFWSTLLDYKSFKTVFGIMATL